MSLYFIVLYLHLITLTAGIAAATLAHFCMARLERAQTGSDARQWHGLLGRVSKVFPAVIIGFFATGAYMVAQKWSWHFGFVLCGAIVGISLLVNGIIVATRSRVLAAELQAAGDGPLPADVRAMIHDPILQTLPWVNLAIVLGTVFVMTTKPALTEALLSLLVAVIAGLLFANRMAARHKQAALPETAAERLV